MSTSCGGIPLLQNRRLSSRRSLIKSQGVNSATAHEGPIIEINDGLLFRTLGYFAAAKREHENHGELGVPLHCRRDRWAGVDTQFLNFAHKKKKAGNRARGRGTLVPTHREFAHFQPGWRYTGMACSGFLGNNGIIYYSRRDWNR